MGKKKVVEDSRKEADFIVLMELVGQYAEAVAEERNKGGGDPFDIPIIEKELELAEARLLAHAGRMRANYERK